MTPTELSPREIQRQLQQIDPYEFEKLVADVWEAEGYTTTVRQQSGDRGIDVEAVKQQPFQQKVLIQAKRYADSNTIGSDEVRKYATLYQQVGDVDTVVIVTTGDFTRQGKRLARDLDVKTVDGQSLAQMILQNDNEDILEGYIDNKGETSQAVPEREKITPSISIDGTDTAISTFQKCPICASHGEVGFREGNCRSCGTKWTKIEQSFGPNKWEAEEGPENGMVKSRMGWQYYLSSSNSSNEGFLSRFDPYWVSTISQRAYQISLGIMILLGLISVINWSINLLLPVFVTTTIIFYYIRKQVSF